MHANYQYWRDDNERLIVYRVPRLQFAFQKFTDAVADFLKTVDPAKIDFTFPEPTITFDRQLRIDAGRSPVPNGVDSGWGDDRFSGRLDSR